MQRSLTVFAPASIGNLSVGFDALGLALAPMDGALLGDLVQLREFGPRENSADWKLELEGPFADALPADPEENVVLECCRVFQQAARQKGRDIQPLHVLLSKRLPIGSGLGSSASSIVAALEALNRFHDNLLGTPQLFELMARMEGGISGEVHLDNIAPCLFGGLRLCPPGGLAEYALPWPGAWRAVVCWPGTRLVTREARAVLPAELPRKTAVAYGAQFAEFVHALHCGNAGLAASCVVDLIAEPYRRSLLPGFDEAKSALADLGALAVGISGSGPTVFALVDDHIVARKTREWLANNYVRNDQGFVHICRADLGGARSID
ncbi:MAG: homoserine kinase [Xanthomonadales bacterium]|jgi:homoserine kinase|nr:homoserine kinase [Xanthomonadales bacterium]MDH3923637.1 homoserine kinase [Xanthomonadales bacterium]MDH3940242.1 homoserine kinase [Xanthomonadales bacterium]MDH4001307.1 homoserine kinase [Xanthomonadales bacterium]